MAEWRLNMPLLKRQEIPRWSTCELQQTYWCGSHKGAPKRKPTPTRTASSSNFRPTEAIGRTCSQALDSIVETANKRAVSSGLIEVHR